MRILFMLFLLTASTLCLAQQSRSELEAARLDIIKQIQQTQQRLSKAEANKESTLSRLNALEKQIDARTALIANLQEDAILSTTVITNEETAHVQVTKSSDELTEDYNKLLRIRYRNKILNKNLVSLYNTERLNELITKWRYLKNYEAMLLGKGTEIKELDLQSENISSNIVTETTNHSELIKREEAARDSLKLLMQNLSSLATRMNSEERSIKLMLKEQNNMRELFNQAIEKTIFSTIGNYTESTTSNLPSTKNTILNKKGFLPWPLNEAKLINRFGPSPHPTVAGIIVDNKGIDISSSSNSVTAIFAGAVISIAEVEGSEKTVIIRHQNDIYSVYANLQNVQVSKDQTIDQGTILGLAKKNEAGLATIHFELYQGKQNLNPNHWLKNN